jgi:hypothetical protein
MENIIIVNPNDFWDKHREITKQVIREELDKENPCKENGEDILVIEDVCKLLKKSKQTIYNWMEADIIKAITLMKASSFFEAK